MLGGEPLNPAVAAALLAVARGADTVERLAATLNLAREDAAALAERLVAEGLAKWEKRGLILRKKRLVLTERGLSLLPEAKRLLEGVASRVRGAAERLRSGAPGEEARRELEGLTPLLPMLLGLGLLDMMAWSLLAPLLGLPVLEEMNEEDWEEEEDNGDWGDPDEDLGGF